MTHHNRPLDPRVARTQQALHEALISLTLEHGWDALNVQQVCARAGVGRSTFYVHFADAEELLLSSLQREHVLPHPAHANAAFSFLGPLIDHVHGYRTLHQALSGSRCEQAVRRKFFGVLLELVDANVPRTMQHVAQRTAAVRYVAGACNETLTWWLDQRTPQAPLELERCLRQLSTAAITPLR